jgi:predicted phage terminase large subunit-like protein
VHVWREREAGIGGADRTMALTRMLAGFPVHSEPATGSKIVRADPLASQAEAGNVRLVKGDWNRAFLSELADFPYGKNDDQVDAAAGALNKLALKEERRASTFEFRV